MSTNKHTPGPWTSKGAVVTKSNGFKIRLERPRGAAPEAWDGIEEQLAADARLIASAPALLAALQGLLRVMPNGDMSDAALESMIEEGFAPEIRQEGEAIKASREALQQAQV